MDELAKLLLIAAAALRSPAQLSDDQRKRLSADLTIWAEELLAAAKEVH